MPLTARWRSYLSQDGHFVNGRGQGVARALVLASLRSVRLWSVSLVSSCAGRFGVLPSATRGVVAPWLAAHSCARPPLFFIYFSASAAPVGDAPASFWQLSSLPTAGAPPRTFTQTGDSEARGGKTRAP